MPVPIIAAGITAGAGLLGNRQTSAQKAQANLANQQAMLAGKQSSLADTIGGFAKSQTSMAQPALQQAMNYYGQIATGNRGAVQSAIAPQVNQMAETYRGAERGIENNMAAGPARDQQIAELYRQKAGQMGTMPFQARSGAMGQLASFGENGLNRALNAYGSAGNTLSGASSSMTGAVNSYGKVAEADQQRNQNYANIGGKFANILLPYLFGKFGKKGQPSPGAG